MRSIVILTGAGISRESGLATFRDADGIWATVRIEDVATPEAFRADPARVQAFYNARRSTLLDPAVGPNPAHHALARLERDWPGDLLVVTQNIDDLHERAGSRHVLHIHGELLKARCTAWGRIVPVAEDLTPALVCAGCENTGTLRPHVVWFGEMPLYMPVIDQALAEADLFVSIGTSGHVYPAAGFVSQARSQSIRTLELNLEPSEGASLVDEARYGPASMLVPAVVEELLMRR